MPLLVLLHGAPASGKSTLARRWADGRPLALVLDVDVVRSLLGAWQDDPASAGVAARDLALAMARTHLTGGRDVIVPQFLRRTGFADDLASLASEVGAAFVEVELEVGVEMAQRRFDRRSADLGDVAVHGPLWAPMAEIVAAHRELLATRPRVVVVEQVEGDLDETTRRLADAVERVHRDDSNLADP
ncbi:AAA family ATPase [Cellulomonas fengjieae]|uniref:AAA family ATPase n=1 Tax=Cellulomonas fengjieae TaxID=2819978 RepID=UPI001AB01A9A|nr:AAA family ATPase [Cellulomonas fengjieae]MBO3101170.1 AAA family ATPase [Cellulomonas fengjieae]